MSDDKEKSSADVDIVDEDSWEEDTVEADVTQLVGASDESSSSEEETEEEEPGDSPKAAEPSAQSDAPSSRDAPVPDVAIGANEDEPPIDEELSESMRPAPPPIPDHRPSDRPQIAVESREEQADEESPTPPEEDQTIPPAPAAPRFGSEPTSSPFALELQKARRVGTGLWYAGVFLWAYLIVGEYVISADLPEFFGWSLFVGVVVAAFLQGANRIGTEVMTKVGALAIASVVGGAIFLSSIVGSSRRAEYQTVSLLLLVVSVALIFFGIRKARGGLPKPSGAPGINWPKAVAWFLFVGNTLLIAFAFASQM